MRPFNLRRLAVLAAVALAAGAGALVLAADNPVSGNWKLVLSTMPDGVEQAMFVVKIDVKAGKAKALLLSTPVAKFDNAVIDDVKVEERQLSFLIHNADVKVPFALFLPEGDAPPARLLGSCQFEGKRLFARAERTKEFAIDKDKAVAPMVGFEDLKKARDTGYSDERVTLLRKLIETHADLPIAYYARLDLIGALAAGGSTDADLKPEIDKAVSLAERYDPTMKPAVLGQALFSQVAGLKARAEALKRAGKPEEAKATDERLAKLEKAVLEEQMRAAIPFAFKPFAGRKNKSERAVLVELFTGSSCPPCVAADVAFDALTLTYKPSEVILLQYHLNVPAPDPMTTKDAETRAEYYEVEGTPSLLINGRSGPPLGGPKDRAYSSYTQLTPTLNASLEAQPAAKLELTAERRGDVIEAKTKFSALKTTDEVRLRLVLIEDMVRYQGPNGQEFHHHVVRGFPGGVEGLPLKDEAGEKTIKVSLDELTKELKASVEDFNGKREFLPTDRILDLKKLKLVALVQSDKTKEVFQAVQIDLADGN